MQTTPTSTASLIGIDFAHENKLVYVQMKRNEKDRRRANMKHTSKTTTNSIYIILWSVNQPKMIGFALLTTVALLLSFITLRLLLVDDNNIITSLINDDEMNTHTQQYNILLL